MTPDELHFLATVHERDAARCAGWDADPLLRALISRLAPGQPYDAGDPRHIEAERIIAVARAEGRVKTVRVQRCGYLSR